MVDTEIVAENLEQNVKARESANELIDLGITLGTEAGLEVDGFRRYWTYVMELAANLIGDGVLCDSCRLRIPLKEEEAGACGSLTPWQVTASVPPGAGDQVNVKARTGEKGVDQEGMKVTYVTDYLNLPSQNEDVQSVWTNRSQERLDDDSPFPFGKYKGERCGDVPDDYLNWVAKQSWVDEWPGLVEYLNIME